jgi:hypothetical protein
MAAVVRGADSRAFRGGVRLVIARPIAERCPSRQARPSATRRRAMVSFLTPADVPARNPKFGTRAASRMRGSRPHWLRRSHQRRPRFCAGLWSGGSSAAGRAALVSCRVRPPRRDRGGSHVSPSLGPKDLLRRPPRAGLVFNACLPALVPIYASGDDRALWHRPWSEMVPGHSRGGSPTIRRCPRRCSGRCELRGIRPRVRGLVVRLFRACWPV